MSFERPWWLACGLVACAALAVLWVIHDRRQSAALTRFVSVALSAELTRSISVAKRRLQRGLFLVALALLFVALAGPLLGFRWELVSRRGNEIVFAIDTSRSMDTPDMKPSRLTRAKLAIDDFTDHLDGDAVGIVAFAGTAFLVCPITLDYGAFHESLNAVDTSTIPRGGTNLSSAIQEADAALRRRPGSDKILILVTDGEDLEGSAVDAAQAAAHDDGLKIYTVGVGTAGGDLIPIPPAQGGGFVKDESGAYVKSRLDETTLKAIAVATGGFYVPLGTQGEGLETIYTRVLGPLAKHDLASRRQKIYTQRYQWPLAASLLMLLLSLLIGNRRGAQRRARTPGATPSVSLTLPWLGLPWLVMSGLVLTWLAAAPAARADVPGTAEFNAGTAAYKAGQFPQAAKAFQQSISHAPSGDAKRLATQEDAYYNLGNTLYRAGQTTEKSSPQDTLKQWNDAVKAYETALQLRADDADSKFNRDFVKRKIAQLKQDQDQQQNKNQDKNQDNKGQGQSQGQGQGQGQGGGQGQNQSPPSGPQQGQPPPNSQSAQNNPPKPGDAPPPKPGDGKSQPPPQSAGQKPGAPGNGAPQPKDPSGTPDQQADREAREADNQRAPGEMSKEEARELLDSVKGDEKHPMGAPLARRDNDDDTPDKPFKNW